MGRNPGVVCPINWSDELCATLGVWPVLPRATTLQPRWDQTCVETQPTEIDGIWYQDWQVVPLSPEELEEKIQLQWTAVRQLQAAMLSANVVVLPNGNVAIASSDTQDLGPSAQEATAQQYQDYVAAVQAVTDQPNPFELTWPTNPFYAGDPIASAAIHIQPSN